MPQLPSQYDTEAIRFRKLTQNLYEDAGVAFPFSSVPWTQYVRGIMGVWGFDAVGPEGQLVIKFARALNAEYGLGASIGAFDTPSIALAKVARAASGVCRCSGQDMSSLADLITWSSTL